MASLIQVLIFLQVATGVDRGLVPGHLPSSVGDFRPGGLGGRVITDGVLGGGHLVDGLLQPPRGEQAGEPVRDPGREGVLTQVHVAGVGDPVGQGVLGPSAVIA